MSFDLAIARLNDIADDFERGVLGIRGFLDELMGHAQAFESVADDFVKEAWDIRNELTAALDDNQESAVDVKRLVNWLRAWTSRLPSKIPASAASSKGGEQGAASIGKDHERGH